MIFDLDGTLVQTEKLKALSYAQAVVELCPLHVDSNQVIEAFREVVGRSRKESQSRWSIDLSWNKSQRKNERIRSTNTMAGIYPDPPKALPSHA
jgi:hypothetical protein